MLWKRLIKVDGFTAQGLPLTMNPHPTNVFFQFAISRVSNANESSAVAGSSLYVAAAC